MRRAIIIAIASVLFISGSGLLRGQDKMSRQEYIDAYAEWAMKEMIRTGIPASIKLAQGCLESDNGNSRLAREANNHFGIKCHDWTGNKIYHDDDERDECFRSYQSAYESFKDHSDFLTTKQRYADLFELKPGDYRAWARGLKRAGYATSNKYAALLIRIIEENGLDAYDQMVLSGNYTDDTPVDVPAATPDMSRRIFTTNNSEYIITREGDTPKSLRREFDLYPFEIYRYNHFEKDVALDSGMIIYIQPKRFRAEKGNDTHIIEEGETLRDVSQEYGVRIRSLYRKNHLEPGMPVEPGTVIYLRRRAPDPGSREPRSEPARLPDNEEPEMEFEFDG
jgi:hypothetical protein